LTGLKALQNGRLVVCCLSGQLICFCLGALRKQMMVVRILNSEAAISSLKILQKQMMIVLGEMLHLNRKGLRALSYDGVPVNALSTV
jgi:hypothetical protein